MNSSAFCCGDQLGRQCRSGWGRGRRRSCHRPASTWTSLNTMRPQTLALPTGVVSEKYSTTGLVGLLPGVLCRRSTAGRGAGSPRRRCARRRRSRSAGRRRGADGDQPVAERHPLRERGVDLQRDGTGVGEAGGRRTRTSPPAGSPGSAHRLPIGSSCCGSASRRCGRRCRRSRAPPRTARPCALRTDAESPSHAISTTS